jgi:hypothetical protein
MALRPLRPRWHAADYLREELQSWRRQGVLLPSCTVPGAQVLLHVPRWPLLL